jgi:murein L,D-transpeptidase YcbB/YkuD
MVRVMRGGQPVNPAHHLDAQTSSNTVRKRPAAERSCGQIPLPNNFNVYMHDTPERNLFGDVAPPATAACAQTSAVRVRDEGQGLKRTACRAMPKAWRRDR